MDPRGDAYRRSEKAIFLAVLSLRGMHLVQGTVSTAMAWRSYRHPRLAAVTLAVSAAESVWLATRCWDREAVDDPASAWIDTAVGIGGLVTLAVATTDEDRTTWMNWMLPITVDSVNVAATSLPWKHGTVAVTGLFGTCLATLKSSLEADRSLAASVAASAICYPGFYLAANRFVAHLRRSAAETERTRDEAVDRGERLAIERERTHQHRRLNTFAFDALDAIAQGWDEDRDEEMRARVRREAARLRSALRGERGDDEGSLAHALEELAETWAEEGLNVELVLGQLSAEPTAARVGALRDAASEALDNVALHAGVSRVVIRACSEADHIEVTVRDHGLGFESARLAAGIGIARRIVGPLRDAGGSADVQSLPGRGTRVVLRVPR